MINESCAKTYCCEDISLIENYDKAIADQIQTWDCHHRLEIQGRFVNSHALLDKCGMYYNVPAWQLVFLTRNEHIKLHSTNRSENTIAKIINSKVGKNNPFYGKTHSMESRAKMSAAKKGKLSPLKNRKLSKEHKAKISEANAGKNNPFYNRKHSIKTRAKMSNAGKGRHWWNNGIIQIKTFECPEGYVKGRLK